MTKLYQYVGPDEIRRAASGKSAGWPIGSVQDVAAWARATAQDLDSSDLVVATFVVTHTGEFWIADRRSEHVSCSGGKPVLSAGEVTFKLAHDFEIVEISNQSTGYCPEPESWTSVESALRRAGVPHPRGFTTTCTFRRCPACGQRNIVKDGWFVCEVCGHDLPSVWNFP